MNNIQTSEIKPNINKKRIIIVIVLIILAILLGIASMFYVSFKQARKYIVACEVAEIRQSESSKFVKMKLKNGKEFSVFQPKLNENFKLVFENAQKCGPVMQINEK
jgi:flagellar basal body-associated protein FliL